jgi:CHAT domain-containing protein
MKISIAFFFIFIIHCVNSLKAQNPVYATQLSELIRLYSAGQMKKACAYGDSVLQLIKTQKKKQDTSYPYILYYTSIVNGLQKNFDKCSKLVPELEEVCLKRYGQHDMKYWSALDFQRLLLFQGSNIERRLKYQLKAMAILFKIYETIGSGEVKSFDFTYKKQDIQFYIQASYCNLAVTYANLNDHKKALDAYKEAEKYFDDQYTLYLDPQSFLSHRSTYGSYLLMIEELEQAEKVFAGLELWVRNNFTSSHPVRGEMLYRLGNFCYSLGQLAKSEKYLLEAKKIFETTFQKNNSDYFFTVFRLCDIYFSGYHAERMDLLINDLKKVAAKTDTTGKVTFVYSKIYLIDYYEKINENKKVDSIIATLDEFFKGKDFTYSYTYNGYLSLKAEQFEKKKLYQEADSVYRIRLSYRENIGVRNTKAYANLLLKRSSNLFNWNKTNEAIDELKKSIQTITSNLEHTFSFLSEGEKLAYIATTTSIFNQLNSIAYQKKEPDLVKLAYNCQLILKELLLKTSVLVNKPAVDKDSAYNKSFAEYTELRKKLVYQATSQEVEMNNYEGLIKEAEKMEKKLAKSSANFIKNQFKPANVEELQNALRPNEAAIEFTHFEKGDSIYYMAIVTKKGSDEPDLVPLFEKKQLDDFFTSTFVGSKQENINLRYARNNTLYKLIWQPIESYLPGISKIYFSLSGELFKIPVTIIPIHDSLKICDRYQLIQLSSTSSVVKHLNYKLEKDNKLYLFGGIFYDGDSTELINAATRYNFNDYVTRSLPEDIFGDYYWPYLPDTKTEVETIYKTATTNNLKAVLYTGWEATEESVKTLSGQRSPEVLHFATHGFFYPDPLTKKSKYKYTVGASFTNADDPLMRSGICLAGANYAWDNKPLKGIQDGVLTSYEISNLDLPNTKLVVLSACETGLGDIIEHEGVFGLQRAFKIAGVKNLVMSLWSVPDDITADFIVGLYNGLLQQQNIEEAFQNAQTSFRKKFPNEPFKWGAWVLVK